MHIRAADFNAWLGRIAPNATLSQVAERSHLSLSTLSTQRTSDRLPAKTILAIAQGYDKNPIRELSTFEGYTVLALRPTGLSSLVPLYSALDLLHEQFVRSQRSVRDANPLKMPHDALKRWVNLSRAQMTQKELASQLQMQPGNFSRELNNGDISFSRIMEVGRILDVNPLVGLIASENIEFTEAFGVDSKGYLARVSDQELLEALQIAQKFLSQDLASFVA